MYELFGNDKSKTINHCYRNPRKWFEIEIVRAKILNLYRQTCANCYRNASHLNKNIIRDSKTGLTL